MKNDNNCTKVFTSVALFAMLTGPLNAFPWVLNGLVESLVSLRRLDAFLSLQVSSELVLLKKIMQTVKKKSKNTKVIIVWLVFIDASL